MALDYQDAYNRSRDTPAFSNGTEGETWTANWCARCTREAPFRSGLKGATGCPLILVTYMGRTPAEFLDGPRDEHDRYSMENQYHCVEFRAPGGGGGEPKPKPVPRGQHTLFGRPETSTRMYVQPKPEHVEAVTVDA